MSYRVCYRGSDGILRTSRPFNARQTADEFVQAYRRLMAAKGREPAYEMQRRYRGVWNLCCG